MREYITCAETAKLVRLALAEKFPAVKFSVRSSVYSMGASIDVSWTEGPQTKAVEAVTSRFEGSTFDSSQDLKSSVTTLYQGRRVHFEADSVSCYRRTAEEARLRAERKIQDAARKAARTARRPSLLELGRLAGQQIAAGR